MKVCIIGASSYIGARLFVDLRTKSEKYELVGTYHSTKLSDLFVHLDITDEKAVTDFILKEKPDYIIHVANNASSGWCETNKKAAKLLNITSTKYIVDAANEVGSKIIYISSVMAIKPVDYYGKTKRKSEKIIKKTKAGWVILQPSLTIGFSPNTSNDRPFNRILKNLDVHAQTPQEAVIQYDDCWQFQPTWLGHISEIIDTVIRERRLNFSCSIATPEFTTRFALAKDILGPFGVAVRPLRVDKPSKWPDYSTSLKEVGLPIYSYSQIIEKIVEEIKHRKSFVC